MRLKGKVAIVTGSSQGIGRGIALKLAGEGADVVVNYRQNAEMAAAVAEKIGRLGCRTLAIQADVSQIKDVDRMVETALEAPGKIDILVNNAGLFIGGGIVQILKKTFGIE